MRIAVVGAHGQLGAALVHAAASRHDVIAFDRRTLDVTDEQAIEAAMAGCRPDAIVNCSGYNAVDAAEDHPVQALEVNAFAVRSLARVARAAGIVLVHYGSDFVFDGTATAPYTEDDRCNPRSTYAASKMLGEWFALDAPRAYVLRVESLFDGAPNARVKGSVAGIVDALRAGREPTVFSDRTITPTSVVDASEATLALLERNVVPGLYHCVNTGMCTWLELAHEAARLLGVAPTIKAVKMGDVPLKAERPLFCALSNDKLRAAGITMPTWQTALARYVARILSDA
jgi:dTDP-4-dehydrorhamnose reductase